MMPLGTGGFCRPVVCVCVFFFGVIYVATKACAKNSKFGWLFLYWVSSQMTFRVKEWYSFQMYIFSTYLKFGYCLVLIPKITTAWFTWLRVYVYRYIYMKNLSHHICKAYHNIISTWAAFHSGVADWHRPSGFGSGPSNHDRKNTPHLQATPRRMRLIRSFGRTGG